MEQIFRIDSIYYEITKNFTLQDIFKLREVCSAWKNCIENHLTHERFISIDDRFISKSYSFKPVGFTMNIKNWKKIQDNVIHKRRDIENKLKYLPNIEECYVLFKITKSNYNQWLKLSNLLSELYPNLRHSEFVCFIWIMRKHF